MNYKNLLYLLLMSILLSLALVFTLNYSADAFCQFHCSKMSLQKYSLNPYVQNGQRILKFNDAKQIILGSSRGQTTSIEWIEKKSNLKTLNLSIAAANINTKNSLIQFADKNLKLKSIIWYADFYEFLDTTVNEISFIDISQIQETDSHEQNFLSSILKVFNPQSLKNIFDHNTTEASFKYLRLKNKDINIDQGSGVDIKPSDCETDNLPTKEKEFIGPSLNAEIEKTYQKYTKNILKTDYSLIKLEHFKQIIKYYSYKNIFITIVLPGYHPYFSKRLSSEFPEIYKNHLKWVSEVTKMNSEKIKVIDAFENRSSNELSTLYWNDGDHFTCLEASHMMYGH